MDVIQEINNKYTSMEVELDNKLEMLKKEEMKIEQCMNSQRKKEGTNTSSPSKELSFLEALNRNSAILKSLERTKARLRSRATFSPLEQILERTMAAYQQSILNAGVANRGTETNPNI